jgi:flagellar assembly protein FliH
MASKIIKQGTERSLEIRRFSFTEDFTAEPRSAGHALWPEVSDSCTTGFEEPDLEVQPSPAIDMDALQKEAYEKGYREAEAKAKQSAASQIEAAMKRYADSIVAISGLKNALQKQAEREVVKLAIEVAKKIVHREIEVDRNVIQTLVRVALSQVTEKKSVTVRLNPADYKYLLEQREMLPLKEDWDISLQSDNSIGQGGCLVETTCGDIDARIEEKFREVENAFFEDLK